MIAASQGASGVDFEAHREFLNGYYKWSRPVYDLSRKYYLLGRDRVLRELLREDWTSLIEIGPGTGRNLAILHRGRPTAKLGGVEPCDEMLQAAQKRLPEARFVRGFAEDTAYDALLGTQPDRILFSYCLSMVLDAHQALEKAWDALAPGGQIVVVDFGDQGGMPGLAGDALRVWLKWFHVHPLDPRILEAHGATVVWGPARYYVVGRIFKARADA